VEGNLAAKAARTGQSVSEIVVATLRAHLDTSDIEADLLDELDHDFLAGTFRLDRRRDGALTVAVVDLERRSTDPLGRTYVATTAPLTQFVGVEAHVDSPGRATIELVGLPGTEHSGIRVWVATLPLCESRPDAVTEGAVVTVALADLHPLTRADKPNRDTKEKS
jgi:hypothetical protein